MESKGFLATLCNHKAVALIWQNFFPSRDLCHEATAFSIFCEKFPLASRGQRVCPRSPVCFWNHELSGLGVCPSIPKAVVESTSSCGYARTRPQSVTRKMIIQRRSKELLLSLPVLESSGKFGRDDCKCYRRHSDHRFRLTAVRRHQPLQYNFLLLRFHLSERDSHSDVRLDMRNVAQRGERFFVMSDCHLHS